MVNCKLTQFNNYLGLLEHKESFSGKDILSIVRGVDTDGSGTVNYSGHCLFENDEIIFFSDFQNSSLQLSKTTLS